MNNGVPVFFFVSDTEVKKATPYRELCSLRTLAAGAMN